MNRLPFASRPAQRITRHTASPVRYWLTPSQTTIVLRVHRSPLRAAACSKSSISKSTATNVTLFRSAPAACSRSRFTLAVAGMIHFENLDRVKRFEPPGPRIEARTEQHDLLRLTDRLLDPVVDQTRAGDAGGSRARPTQVDVASPAFAHRTYGKQLWPASASFPATVRRPADRQTRAARRPWHARTPGTSPCIRRYGLADAAAFRGLRKKNVYSF